MNETEMASPTKEELRARQVKEAEDLFFSEPESKSLAKELFLGHFAAELAFPYPQLKGEAKEQAYQALEELRACCDEHLDPREIDEQEEIPRELIQGLAQVGLMGMTAPTELGGHGFSQLGYCLLLEEIGKRCGATSIFVNAHHSIGMRALLLYGTDRQKEEWLPGLVDGSKLAAFALTEVAAGSDAANVQTTATWSDDDRHYILNGEKRYITNGAQADMLTVMARTQVPGTEETKVTAFLVSPDMLGFQVMEPNMRKLGVRGTAQAKLKFENMKVPKENILGPLGKGLNVALTVLNFGRTTFGACCTGGAKAAFELARDYANTRVQFGETLGEFELVQQKIANMAANIYAMEAMTHMTAGLIDERQKDYMLETAMLKVFASENLWTIVNDAFQIHGGAAYFNDSPLGRMLRDARINQIGEGANEVLLSFIALVGMRDSGEQLREVAQAIHSPFKKAPVLGRFLAGEITRRLKTPTISVRSDWLQGAARQLAKLIKQFSLNIRKEMVKHREAILERQLAHEQMATAAIELYAAVSVLSRLDAEFMDSKDGNPEELSAGRLFLKQSARRIQEALRRLTDNDHDDICRVARDVLNS